jgi:hypothetical protein
LRKTGGDATTTISDERKSDLFYLGLIDGSNIPSSCPKCKESDHNMEAFGLSKPDKVLNGPFTRYEKRETEQYFDLKQKYLQCTICGCEITILDFQVLVEEISSTLSPIKARKFSMKMMGLYRDSQEYAIEVLSILRGDFSLEVEAKNDFLEELEKLVQTPSIHPSK